MDSLKRRGYLFGEKIGKGSFSRVVGAVYRSKTGKQVELACKIVDKKKVPENLTKKFLPRELTLLLQLKPHPNIIKTHSIFENGSHVFIFMRRAEKGDLLNYIRGQGPIAEPQANLWFFQMTSAVKHLHSINYAHRDLKCENILISANLNLKICDFGFARCCSGSNTEKFLSETFCGSDCK